MNTTNEEGYLRKAEKLDQEKKADKYSPVGARKNISHEMIMCLKMISCQRATGKVRYTWGASSYTIQQIINKEMLDDDTIKRKERNDKRLILFNSERQRQSTITLYSVLKKEKRIENNGKRLKIDLVYLAWRRFTNSQPTGQHLASSL